MKLGTAGQDEMLMQDAAGDFEVYQYNASLNAFVGNSMGKVGAPWVVDGIAANTSSGGATAASTAQLVQAMASMGIAAATSNSDLLQCMSFFLARCITWCGASACRLLGLADCEPTSPKRH